MPETYHDPVAQLLTLGDVRGQAEWRDYAALGLGAEHVPELIRMALDRELYWADDDSAEVWAPVHAWRALGQLRAASAVEPLLQLLDRDEDEDDDMTLTELPEVLGMIGPEAIPALQAFLGDPGTGESARQSIPRALASMAERFPEARGQAVAILTEQLRGFAAQDPTLNALLVGALCDLAAVESAAVIEQAYAADAVEEVLLGDWEEAQIILGLLDERTTPAPYTFESELGSLPPVREREVGVPDWRKAEKKKKAKRKQAKAARKRNRKR